MGNLLTDTIDEVVNNSKKLKVQTNMRQGIFSDCTDYCHHLSSFLSNKNDYWPIIPIENLDNKLKNTTMHIQFSYDNSCNLQCPSCRTELTYWDPADINDHNGQIIKKVHARVKELIDVLLAQGNKILLQITGSGDPFASPLYWNYLLELANKPIHKNISIQLDTNGILMTEENLIKIKPLWPHIIRVNFSIDAATNKTYKIIRKNGNFTKLQKNLNILDHLIAEEKFPNLINWQTNFIVQKDNYKELEEYVKWQLTLKSKPLISLSLIGHWIHLSNDKFKSMAVWDSLHPERNILVEILKNPIFKNSQIRGNISSLMPK
jgi:MoaA/NifB/PqqE/SkfB family radical SAM enzyme